MQRPIGYFAVTRSSQFARRAIESQSVPLGECSMANVTFRVNGTSQTIEADDPNMQLLYALRDNMELHGPKFGCGLGQCGACTVIVDGNAVRSCQKTVSQAQGRQITTLEGLGSPEQMH